MLNSKFLMAGLLTVALVLSLACSDSDSNDSADEQPVPQATGSPDDTGDSGSGGATLTIGSESWTFDDVFCAFSPEEAGNDRISFTMTGFTETADGVRVQLDATIVDREEQGRYEGDGVTYIISINDVEDFENPAVGWSSMWGLFRESVNIIQVDGKSVTAEVTFDNELTEDVIEETPGTLEGTCP